MKIIVVGPSYEDYTAASYQNEFMKELRNLSESYYHYKNKGDITITELISYSKFTPDIIFYNHGWLSDNVNLEDIKYLRLRGRRFNNIKHIVFLNKEYVLLKEKLEEINKYKFDLIFTHLHDFGELNSTSIKSVFLPLACSFTSISKKRFKRLSDRKYDLYFSGILQNWDRRETQGDLRKRIQAELFYCIYDFPLLRKFKYWNLEIYWKPFYKNRIKNIISNFLHGKRLNQKDYLNKLANSKCVLHTSSPIGIISTRVFEAVGSGAIGLFSEESNADVVIKDQIHFLSFSTIDDFISKIYKIKSTSKFSSIQKIADQGRLYIENEHTWKNRVLKFKDEVFNL
mgnify:CR=1 FL=1